jgi:hypothetical protein
MDGEQLPKETRCAQIITVTIQVMWDTEYLIHPPSAWSLRKRITTQMNFYAQIVDTTGLVTIRNHLICNQIIKTNFLYGHFLNFA